MQGQTAFNHPTIFSRKKAAALWGWVSSDRSINTAPRGPVRLLRFKTIDRAWVHSHGLLTNSTFRFRWLGSGSRVYAPPALLRAMRCAAFDGAIPKLSERSSVALPGRKPKVRIVCRAATCTDPQSTGWNAERSRIIRVFPRYFCQSLPKRASNIG